jgi:hypothetical protein
MYNGLLRVRSSRHEGISGVTFILFLLSQLKDELTGTFNSKVTASGLARCIASITVPPSPAPGMCRSLKCTS